LPMLLMWRKPNRMGRKPAHPTCCHFLHVHVFSMPRSTALCRAVPAFFLDLPYTVPHAKYEIPSTEPYTDKPLELYDLAADIAEEQDISAESPDVVVKFEAYLKRARTESVNWPVKT